jgi:hypothetical protein
MPSDVMYHCLDCGMLLTGADYMEHSASHTVERVKIEKISTDPYPDLWVRTRRYLKEKHPDLRGIPSREMLIDLLLKEAGF